MEILSRYTRRSVKLFITTALVVVNSFYCYITPAQAATVDNLTDQTSSLQVSTASNHTFTFTLVDTWSESETISITFPSLFDTSTISIGDVDLANNGGDLIIGSSCGSTTQLAVTISSDVFSMTRCAGAAGEASLGATVVVEIGTNASFGTNGTNQITNPATEGTYYVALGGNSGNDGSIPLPIGPRSTAGVSVSLTGGRSSGGSGGGGGGGGSPPNPDPDPDPEPEPDPDDEPDPDPDPEVDPEPDRDPDPDPEPEPDPDDEPDPDGDQTPDTDPENDPVEDSDTDSDQTVDDEDSPGDVQNEEGVVIDIGVYATPGLELDENRGEIEVLPGVPTIVVVTVAAPNEPAAVILVVGESEFVLSPQENGTFSGTISAPITDEVLSAVAIFNDGSSSSQNTFLNVINGGSVYEIVDNQRVLLSGSVVTAYDLSQGTETVWDANNYDQQNPLVTNSGYFSWYAPNGVYVIYANKSGYTEGHQTVNVSNNILAADIELDRQEKLLEPILSSPKLESILQVATQILQTPEAQTIADIAMPASLALAAGTAANLATGFNLLPYLQYLFTSPLLFFSRRKRRAFGTVYNSITKVPIALAVIRVYSLPGNRLIKQVVSSPDGKYSLAIAPGKYRLQAIKSGFIFPSQYLKDQTTDGNYLDVYTGQIIEVNADEALIAANIPLDPSQADAFHAPRWLAFKRFARTFQFLVTPIGVILSIIVLLIKPSSLSAILFGAQFVALLLTLKLVKVKRPKGWGIVYDQATRRPVGNAVIRMFEPKYNKLVETVLSDSLGRYSFLLGQNEYFVTFNKPGYAEKVVRPIDYTDKPEPAPWATNVALQHVSGESHASAS